MGQFLSYGHFYLFFFFFFLGGGGGSSLISISEVSLFLFQSIISAATNFAVTLQLAISYITRVFSVYRINIDRIVL